MGQIFNFFLQGVDSVLHFELLFEVLLQEVFVRLDIFEADFLMVLLHIVAIRANLSKTSVYMGSSTTQLGLELLILLLECLDNIGVLADVVLHV